jgi:hypothetical protein
MAQRLGYDTNIQRNSVTCKKKDTTRWVLEVHASGTNQEWMQFSHNGFPVFMLNSRGIEENVEEEVKAFISVAFNIALATGYKKENRDELDVSAA